MSPPPKSEPTGARLSPPKSEPTAARLSRLLLQPGPRLTDVGRRRTSVLFAACLLCLLVLFGGFDAFLVLTVDNYHPPWFGYAGILLAYWLLRAGFYGASATITLGMFPVVAFALVVAGRTPVPATTLSMPVLSVLLATLLLDAAGTAAIAVFSAALILLTALPGLRYGLPFAHIAGPLALNLLGGALAVLSIVHRNQLEKARRQDLEQSAALLEHHVALRTAELRSTVSELEAFSYSVSHDLRAPLRAVEGFSAMLVEDHGERLGNAGLELVELIRRSTVRMSELIDGLLGLSRVTRAPLERTSVDLVPLAEEVLAALRIADKGRVVEFVSPGSVTVSGDARLIRAVLENLLGNAWKFSARQPEARISLECAEKQGRKVICVRDNGVGFDMQHAGQLFRAFERLHKAGEFPGNGIGLATVQRIVNRHGGQVFAEAEPGGGAAFFFDFGPES